MFLGCGCKSTSKYYKTFTCQVSVVSQPVPIKPKSKEGENPLKN